MEYSNVVSLSTPTVYLGTGEIDPLERIYLQEYEKKKCQTVM